MRISPDETHSGPSCHPRRTEFVSLLLNPDRSPDLLGQYHTQAARAQSLYRPPDTRESQILVHDMPFCQFEGLLRTEVFRR
jgi:hypothetical protein